MSNRIPLSTRRLHLAGASSSSCWGWVRPRRRPPPPTAGPTCGPRASREAPASTAYRTDSLLENYDLGQRISLSRAWLLNVDLMTRREQSTGFSGGLRSYTRTTSLMPSFSLNYHRGSLAGVVTGRGLRRDWRGTGVAGRRDENLDVGAWLRAEYEAWSADLRLQELASWRYEPTGRPREPRAHPDPQPAAFLRRPQRAALHVHALEAGHPHHPERGGVPQPPAQLPGQPTASPTGKASVSIDALVQHFRQDGEQTVTAGQRLLVPVWGGFSLDDTPGFRDPFEPDPVQDTRLYDRDRDVRAGVNLGDAGVVVQQYGGDWCNLIVDFGEPQAMVSALLYVDTRVAFPAFFSWQVYVSDDPEGRDWGTALDPSSYSIVYRDLADNRQGWELVFNQPVSHRRLKLVDIKAGVTEPDIYVTELEVYGPADENRRNVSRILRGRLRGDVNYHVTPAVELHYGTELDQRRYLDDHTRLTSQLHVFGATWDLGDWHLRAQHQMDRLTTPTGRFTKADGQLVSLSSTPRRPVAWRFSWQRTNDRSYTLRNLTNTGAAEVNWRAFPRLTLNQKVLYGVRDAENVEGVAHSWALVTTARGDVRANIFLVLRRADRWTDREAGSGFTRFNDTEWTVNWSLLPLVSLTSRVAYKEREDTQWILQHTLSWAPLPGGSVSLRFYGSDYQDTRNNYLRRGAGATVVWDPRPRLRLEAGVEQTLVKENADRNTPLNLNARGSWTF